MESSKRTELEPRVLKASFKCPHCGVLAQQEWVNNNNFVEITDSMVQDLAEEYKSRTRSNFHLIENFINYYMEAYTDELERYFPKRISIANCLSCKEPSLWIDRECVYPTTYNVEEPNKDLPEHIMEIYIEAAVILHESPKGAAALLRLALQELLHYLGYKGDINRSIAKLVKEGLNPNVQIALDTLRVVGNNCVHPGQIVFEDNKEDAKKLFSLLNYITAELVTSPKERERLFQDLVPDITKEHIQQRDRSKPTS
ncbi:TPA: DUF4145 domain-containing protein [Vibrio parahaemolyticus]|nr:DUF4145 domain-containing protein [Vibrio parahaemolyticus]